MEGLRWTVHGAITAVQADLEGNLLTCQPTRRVIVVPGKLVNLVP